MKKLLPIALIIILISCKKAVQPSKTCGFITDKYLFNNSTPFFEIGETVVGDGIRMQVTHSDYNSYQVGEQYCY